MHPAHLTAPQKGARSEEMGEPIPGPLSSTKTNAETTPKAEDSNAANRVFAVPELLENILLHMPSYQVCATKAVCKTFLNTVNGSSKVQQKMQQPLGLLAFTKVLRNSKLPTLFGLLEVTVSTQEGRFVLRINSSRVGWKLNSDRRWAYDTQALSKLEALRGGSWTRIRFEFGQDNFVIRSFTPRSHATWFEFEAGAAATLGGILRQCIPTLAEACPELAAALVKAI